MSAEVNMGLADEMKKLWKGKTRRVDDDETDMDEMSRAGISIRRGDPRLSGGIRQSNMTQTERAKLRKLRQG